MTRTSSGSSHSSLRWRRSEEHTSELQSHLNLVCRLLLEKKKKNTLSLLAINLTSLRLLKVKRIIIRLRIMHQFTSSFDTSRSHMSRPLRVFSIEYESSSM